MDGGKKGWQDFLIHRYSCQNNKLILKYLFKLFVCVFLNEVLFIFFNFIKDKKNGLLLFICVANYPIDDFVHLIIHYFA